MSENQLVQETEDLQSAEDKFFGVKTTFSKKKPEKKPESSEFEFEVVDDRPPQDRRPPRESEPIELADEELDEYSEKVQKRLKGLKFDFHEERRQKEEANRMREEAVKVAQQYASKVQEQESLISRGESALVEQIKQRTEASLIMAKDAYKKAYEEGDTDAVVETQGQMMKAQTELSDINRYENNLSQSSQKQQQQQEYNQQLARQNAAAQQQQQVALTPEAKTWADNNDWFMQDGNEEMTSLAYGAHTTAVRQGIPVNTQNYFTFIDTAMRQRFPEYDWPDKSDTDGGDAPVTTSRPSTVVAPSARNNGAKPRKVRLTATQVALAKRLGLTNEQYARSADML